MLSTRRSAHLGLFAACTVMLLSMTLLVQGSIDARQRTMRVLAGECIDEAQAQTGGGVAGGEVADASAVTASSRE